MMIPSASPRRQLLNSLLAIAIVAASTLILLLLRPYFTGAVIALLYLVPVILSATLWGWLAGILASILSFFAFNYFFVTPLHTFRVEHPQDFIMMLVFFSVAMLTGSLMAAAQARLNLVRMREREAVQLYELSVDLAGQVEPFAIASIIANRLWALFPEAKVEVRLSDGARACVPEGDPPTSLASREFKLSLARGDLGVIRLWTGSDELTAPEARLVSTFASQGALALERAMLAVKERQARMLEESERLRTAIFSSVSHDLRTPLATIQASATSLFNPQVDLQPEARAELEALLLEETEHMSQLVGNLLNMSRIEAGALKLQLQWSSLAEIVDAALRRMNRLLRQHQVESDVSDDLPLVSVDAVLIEQVIINLVSNGIKFAPPESPIRISAGVEGAMLQVTISNQGPPIPAAHLEHVFDRFTMIPGQEVYRGVGLGLSICKALIEAHGGRIWALNQPDGVAFSFNLPLTREGHPPLLPEEEKNE